MSFAGEQSFAQQHLGALQRPALDEVALICDQNLANIIRMIHQIHMLAHYSKVDQIAVLARRSGQESERIGAKRTQVSDDGRVLRPGGTSAYCLHSSTTACASAESPSPTGPRRSAVLNFTDT